ncbi:hypothetical protein KUTeg_012626 [Tegillarca granosa]|uniref:Rho guanine nucleotide exchange factor 6/7 coiled-coil domain-containing protein n=1 Tax=Tegillarca granosa TaxID=220873 RepID=A0ABQ9F036_TEGGR|nr:hypothetical protein KUTeg_012626 [Tegillarca granosa]
MAAIDNKNTSTPKNSFVSSIMTLVDTEQKKMRRDLEDETKARKQLENRIKKFIKSRPELGCEDNT